MALSDTHSAAKSTFPTEEQWLQGLRGRRLRKYIPIAIGGFIVFLMLSAAILAPLISPFSPSAQFSDYVLKGPGAGGKHMLGTDEFGRDLLSRIIWGTRVSLEAGLGAVLVGFLIGVPLGIMAGFMGGAVEVSIMRFMDMLLGFPTLLLALIIVTAMPAITALGEHVRDIYTNVADSLPDVGANL